MKRLLFSLFALLAALSAASQRTSSVNLYIGTGGHGHTHPAAVVPHGMIQPGPDTRRHGWDACSGYHYADSLLNGFAHTRLSGTGCADFGDFLLMPYTGAPHTEYVGELGDVQNSACASPFSHDAEICRPGYYAVRLERYGIKAELTATARTARHRYRYPAAGEAGIILDLDYNIQEQGNLAMEVEQVGPCALRARKYTYGWANRHDAYFYMESSRPFRLEVRRDTVPGTQDEYMRARCRAVLHFGAMDGPSTVELKAAVSAVDAEGARGNLLAESYAATFDEVRAAADSLWEQELAAIDIETADTDKRTIFYTALYHCALAPALFQDADGRYRGQDLAIHQGDTAEPNYTIFSLWDTFRALHPLVSILRPADNEAYIRCLVRKTEEGGVVPKWDCAANYTGCMPGYHFASLAADAWSKGMRGFDIVRAYRAAQSAADFAPGRFAPAVPRWLTKIVMPEARKIREKYGYFPCDSVGESVAEGLESAYDDFCMALLAEASGDTAAVARYARRSEQWRRYYDASTGFMRGRDSHGAWRTPFNPYAAEHRADDYCEGNAWQWTWFVPHDVEGLMAAMGGRERFVERLDSLFSASAMLEGQNVSPDISGLIGQYAHGNEPSHHIAHLYNYAGRPDRTQQRCDSILSSQYRNAPDGLSGNEDCGQMSAWYVMNALGLYQVCPGRPVYSIGRPIFDEAAIHLPGGRTFTVVAHDIDGPGRRTIGRMTLDGAPLSEPFIAHERLMQGGRLDVWFAAAENP